MGGSDVADYVDGDHGDDDRRQRGPSDGVDLHRYSSGTVGVPEVSFRPPRWDRAGGTGGRWAVVVTMPLLVEVLPSANGNQGTR